MLEREETSEASERGKQTADLNAILTFVKFTLCVEYIFRVIIGSSKFYRELSIEKYVKLNRSNTYTLTNNGFRTRDEKK